MEFQDDFSQNYEQAIESIENLSSTGNVVSFDDIRLKR